MQFRTIIWVMIAAAVISTGLNCGPQSRKLSRITGVPVTIELPEDCVKVVSVSVTPDKEGNNSVKNLTYINTEGHLITREFTDWGMWEGSIKWVRSDGSAYASVRVE